MNPLGMWTNLRSQIDSYVGVVGRRFLSLIWVVAICGVIWVFGPRLNLAGNRPLDSAAERGIAIGIVIVLWLIWMGVSWLRARRAEGALIDDVAESPAARAAAETKEEIAELRDRLRTAMQMMRKVVKRRYGYAYEFPWYLMMGAPGAGKTTLLTNSGLKFPLGDAMGAEPVHGVGGTRNCNWWFTDQAILIDTAGRYTTQESGHERDKAGFDGFLGMLRRRRPAQPINGVILTLSLTDLLDQEPEDRLRDVRAIRQRLSEIEDTLKARVPVYLVLTKADRLKGFAPFFEHLGNQGREQVWGMTFDLSQSRTQGQIPDMFTAEFRALQDRLNGLLLERLQQETDIERRGRIFRFPAQVGALHDALREIVEELSSGTAHIAEPLIRGVYFASATQDVLPARRKGPTPARSMNRSYFVSKLFNDVILGEAALVGRDHRVSRRKQITTSLAYGATSLVFLVILGAWLSGYGHNRQALARTNDELARYTELAGNIPVRDVADSDFLRILPALNALSSVPASFETGSSGNGAVLPLHRMAIGLDREGQITRRHAAVYADALGGLLLPRYMVALQDKLKSDDLTEAEAFETLKHYLSLAGFGPIDPDALLAQSEQLFDALFAGSGRAMTRGALQRHMRALLERGELPVMVIDDALVRETRDTIADRTPAQRAYDLLKTRPAARSLPDWTLEQTIGPAAAKAFTFEDGDTRDTRVAGLLTREGYQTVVLTQLGAMSEIAATEDWVRGTRATADQSVSRISSDAIELYWADFANTWRRIVARIVIRDVSSLADASELVALVSSEANPIERLAASIVRKTDLLGAPEGLGTSGDAGRQALAASAAGLPFDPLAAPDPYGPLRRALQASADGTGDTAPQNAFAALTPLLDQVYQQLGRVSATDGRAAEVFSADSQLNASTQELVAAARLLPGPADAWVVGLAGRIANAAMIKARLSVDALWQAGGAGECRRAIDGRYPFDREASSEVTLNDFERMFSPQGLFATFFEENLAEFVDVSSTPWIWKGGLGTTGRSSDALQQFQRAAAIRTAFFPTDTSDTRVEVTFDLSKLDPNARLALVEIGEERSVHGLDRAQRRTLIWPGDGPTMARITLLPGERTAALQANGPWAPFRLFDMGKMAQVSENQFDVSYRIDARDVSFRVTSGSVNNPFRLPALLDFSCPDAL